MASVVPFTKETLKIDSAGDVILIVGSSNPARHLLVSSKVLSLASPVFAAMFSPHFKEGLNLHPDHPTEVPLPEDDVEAMTLLCNCLHFRTEHIPRNPEFTALKALAIVCDKYDAAKAISAWSILWLQKWDAECEDGFEGLLAVIYSLDCAEAFTKTSKKALLRQVAPFYMKRVPDGFDMVPDSILEGLEVQRGAFQTSLQKALEDIANPMLSDVGETCRHGKNLTYAYFRKLKSNSLWPFSEEFQKTSLSDIMDRISLISEFNVTEGSYCQCTVCKKLYRPLFIIIKNQHMSSIKGLCLDCVKGGEKQEGDNGKCRVAHS